VPTSSRASGPLDASKVSYPSARSILQITLRVNHESSTTRIDVTTFSSFYCLGLTGVAGTTFILTVI
jgi:hypothetical protein